MWAQAAAARPQRLQGAARLCVLQVLRDILKEVQSNMVPRSMLKEWALHTFPNATDYWTFRKMFTIQLALIGFAEFVLHLNRLNPEMLQIAQVSGPCSRPCPCHGCVLRLAVPLPRLHPAAGTSETSLWHVRTPESSTLPTSDLTSTMRPET